MEKSVKLGQIRRKGNFEAMLKNSNDVVLSRRTKAVDLKKYIACTDCKILIKKSSLRRHMLKSCPFKSQCTGGPLSSHIPIVPGILHEEASETFRTMVFPKFRDGPLKELFRNDVLIITYANHLCAKYRGQHHYPMIRNRIILVTKCLLEAKKLDPSVNDLRSLLIPDNYKTIEACVNILGCYNPETQLYEKPSLPTTLGTYLKYITKLLRNRAIENKDERTRNAAMDLYGLLETRLVAAFVNKTSVESLLQNKRQNLQELPVFFFFY